MANRKVYADKSGNLYFKGEGFRFYVHPQAGFTAGDVAMIISVSCGQAGAVACYVDTFGRRRSIVSAPAATTSLAWSSDDSLLPTTR